MKRAITLTLTIIMIFTLVAGCSPKPQEPAPNSGGNYKDGTYTEKGEPDDKGWAPEVTITVKDGKITEANYDEISDEGKLKTEDEDYKESFMKVNNVDVIKVYEKFGSELVNKQDPSKVDATGGATSSGNKFIELSQKALEKAK